MSSSQETAEPLSAVNEAFGALDGIVELNQLVLRSPGEDELSRAALVVLERALPDTDICLRCLDVTTGVPARCYTNSELRAGLDSELIVRIDSATLARAELAPASRQSGRLVAVTGWYSPFREPGAGYCIPLVAAGELMGLLDIVRPCELGEQSDDIAERLADALAVALRTVRLQRDVSALRDFQARLIERADAPILGIGQDLRIQWCNDAFARLLGFDAKEVLGADVRDWWPSGDGGGISELFLAALRGRRAAVVDTELRAADGSQVRICWSVTAVGDGGSVAIGRDETPIVDLQKRVVQAEKMATLGQLAAGVVHELNTPLTSIGVYADYLAANSDGRSPGECEKIARIQQSAQRIQEFTRALTQYAAPGEPAGDDIEIVEVGVVVRQALSFCEHLFDGTDVTLEEIYRDGMPCVAIVAGHVEQIVINLLTNAVKATKSMGTVRIETYLDLDGYACIAVDDDGPGISPEIRHKIFEPFFTTRTNGEGTGLGLAISQNLVERHGGAISSECSELGGARMIVRLPSSSF